MADQRITDWIKQRAGAYAERESVYQFLAAAYEGGKKFRDGNLFRHSPRETQADFDRRKKQAVYPNFVRSVLKTYRDHVFKRGEAISRDIDDDAFLVFHEDVDRAGHDISGFWSRVGVREILYGWMGVLVDMPQAPDLGREMTRSDVLGLGMSPYYVQVTPSNIVDWSLDSFGRLNWVHLLTTDVRDDDPFAERAEVPVHQLWTRDYWARYDKEGATIAEGEHGLGEVPLVIVRFEESEIHEFIGTSFMEDFAELGRAIMNSESVRGDFLAGNAMQILTVQLSLMSGDAGGDTAERVIRNLIEYDPGESGVSTHPPQFIGPDVSGAQWMFKHVEALREQMYFMAMLQDSEAQVGQTAAESGIAKVIDFEQTSAALSSFADGLEQAETEAARLWFAWQDREWDEEWSIDYPDTFNVRSLENELALALQVREVYGDASPTFVAEYLRTLATRINEDLPEDLRGVIEDELVSRLASLSDGAVLPGRLANAAFPSDEEVVVT